MRPGRRSSGTTDQKPDRTNDRGVSVPAAPSRRRLLLPRGQHPRQGQATHGERLLGKGPRAHLGVERQPRYARRGGLLGAPQRAQHQHAIPVQRPRRHLVAAVAQHRQRLSRYVLRGHHGAAMHDEAVQRHLPERPRDHRQRTCGGRGVQAKAVRAKAGRDFPAVACSPRARCEGSRLRLPAHSCCAPHQAATRAPPWWPRRGVGSTGLQLHARSPGTQTQYSPVHASTHSTAQRLACSPGLTSIRSPGATSAASTRRALPMSGSPPGVRSTSTAALGMLS